MWAGHEGKIEPCVQIGAIEKIQCCKRCDQSHVPDRKEKGDEEDRRSLDEHVDRLVSHDTECCRVRITVVMLVHLPEQIISMACPVKGPLEDFHGEKDAEYTQGNVCKSVLGRCGIQVAVAVLAEPERS